MAVDKYGNPIFSTDPITQLSPLNLPTTSSSSSSLTSLVDSIEAPQLAKPSSGSSTLSLLLAALGRRESQTLSDVGLGGGSDLGAGHLKAQKMLLKGMYAVPAQGKLIGTPYGGTHSLGNWESDNAVDISLPEGTPLRAAANGVIGSSFGALNSKNPRMAGLRLHLNTKGNEFYYAHLSSFAKGIRPGARVKKGQIIGYSGSANGSAHLHLGVKSGDPRGLYT
jgi:murein DD-endopeptidase MepM/ murein hydrolase activator NlpD